MKNKTDKQIYLYILFAVALLGIILQPALVIKLLKKISNLFMPVVVGLLIAFILNVPVRKFENLLNRIFKKRKHKPSEKAIHYSGIILSLLSIALIITFLCVLVVPEITQTIKSLAVEIRADMPYLMEVLEDFNVNTDELKEWLSQFSNGDNIDKTSVIAGNLLGSIADMASSTVSVVSISVTGLIIALYTLADRNKLCVQAKKTLYAYAKEPVADKITYVCRLINKAYANFLMGQCMDCMILGLLITISFAIFRLPYAMLIGAVTAICAIVPYIGALVACVIGVLLALIVSPQKAILCLIVYLAVQFLEEQFIYPRVIGTSVGLPTLWTLIAVILGGKLFGLFGMVFFIPLVSVVYTLIGDDVEKRLAKKNNIQSSAFNKQTAYDSKPNSVGDCISD